MPRFAKKYQDFDIEIKSVLAYITANQVALRIHDAQLTAFTAVVAAWAVVYTPYLNQDRSAADTRECDVGYHIARDAANVVQRQIKADPNVTLSEEGYVHLYIHKDKETITPQPRPTMIAGVAILDTSRLVNKISVYVPTSEQENHRALPDGVATIVRLTAATDTPVAPERSAYTEIDSVGRTVSDIQWPPEDINKFGWVIVMYQNRKGENGPESHPVMMSISSI